MLRPIVPRLAVCFAVAAALPASAQAPAASPAASPALLDCAETFTKTADQAALVRRFGRENVVVGQLEGAEGQTERGSIVYPKDPARRIEVFWWDTKGLRRPASVVVRDKSRWQVWAPGPKALVIGVGTPIGGVEDANEKPFSLSGFSWDMGGYATGWKGGRLDGVEGGCSLSIRFDPDPKAKDALLDKVSGDRTFSSSAPAIKAVRPTVSKLSLDWPE